MKGVKAKLPRAPKVIQRPEKKPDGPSDAILSAALHGTLSGFRQQGGVAIRILLDLALAVQRCETLYAHMLTWEDRKRLTAKSCFINNAIMFIEGLGELGNEILQRAPQKGPQ